MIVATFDIAEDGICKGFRVCGHAEYAPRGSDIVCAAVSALTQGATSTLEQLKYLGVKVDVEEGELTCTVDTPGIASQAILLMVKVSLEQLEAQYGNYVRVHQN